MREKHGGFLGYDCNLQITKRVIFIVYGLPDGRGSSFIRGVSMAAHSPKKKNGVRTCEGEKAACLVGENHEPRVEHNRPEHMTADAESEGNDNSPIPARDLPSKRNERGREDCHPGADDKAHQERDPEAFEDLGNFEPKVRSFHFLLRCSPLDVVREKMSEKGLGEMDAQSAKEEEEEGQPSQSVVSRFQQTSVSETILEKDEADVTKTGEDDHAGKPDLETLEVEAIHFVTPTEQEVIGKRKDEADSKTIIRKHVRHHTDLVMNWGI